MLTCGQIQTFLIKIVSAWPVGSTVENEMSSLNYTQLPNSCSFTPISVPNRTLRS